MNTTPPSELFSVSGKNAVVTGGSRGVGLMIARGLLQAGANVIISSRKVDACEAAVAELSQIGGGVTCKAFPADVSTEQGVAGLAAFVAGEFGSVDVLVNNAGASWGEPLEQFPDAAWDRVLNTNVKGIFELTVKLLPQLRASASDGDPARVINIGSIDGLRVPPMENYSYSASKAAVHMLTRHLAKRLADEQIAVNAIAPGPFESKMTAFFLGNEEGRKATAGTVPLGRIGEPDDIVGTVIFLSSKAGSYLTAAVIPLDGGIVGCA